jgi:Fe-Mn family superoxide dismutase
VASAGPLLPEPNQRPIQPPDSLHEVENVTGFKPILVMDVWEHAYLLDYKPADRIILRRPSNIDWEAEEK